MSAWRPISGIPDIAKDGRMVRLRAGGREFDASREVGFMDGDMKDCAAWCARNEYEAPASWTDGVCWEVNEDGRRSVQPTYFAEVKP